ncbi:MAG TPA: SGNH/GDSL hydrolase family protein, partial [Tepidisphaeraceae bacterium]|nr:SGNH/GDSL hydrolase family protein [Tepidisphaeraceae bacterium]
MRLVVMWVIVVGMAWGSVGVRAEEGRRADFAEFDRRARAGEKLVVVFHGASLTWGANATDPLLYSYRAVVARRLGAKYPAAHFTFRDSAIGGTGSQLGVFRLDRDVLAYKPDLVFVDFSANDGINSATPQTLASYEAIVRRVIVEAKCPVVQVIFPFMWDVAKGKTDGMLRRDAHLAISKAYGTACGDAIVLAQERVKSGAVTVKQIWPHDGVHPGNGGYELFADAAWGALESAIGAKQVCAPPEKMLHADTYMTSVRWAVAKEAGQLPAGWRAGTPNLTSAFFDMLMSRWQDVQAVAGTGEGKEGPRSQPARLAVKFKGSTVMLFGETTMKSGKFRVIIDGQGVPKKDGQGKVVAHEWDAGEFGRRVGGNAHLVMVLAEGLADGEHSLEIEPVFDVSTTEEIRIESICVAGKGAAV